jgi:hypothetical protein
VRTKLYGQQKLSEIKQILGGSHDAVSGVRDSEQGQRDQALPEVRMEGLPVPVRVELLHEGAGDIQERVSDALPETTGGQPVERAPASFVRDFELVTADFTDEERDEARRVARADLPSAIVSYRAQAERIRGMTPETGLTTDPYGKPWKMKEMRADKYLTNEPLERLEK